MNTSMIRYILGYILKIEGVLMLLPCLTAVIYHETEGIIYLAVAAAAFFIGFLMSRNKPKNTVFYLKEGCIVAMRHIHMSPKDAQAAGVKDGDIVSVKADNERGTIFNQVKIRVDDSFTLEMHIDTDEANAAKIVTGNTVTIIK